jgi:hypothetical protein
MIYNMYASTAETKRHDFLTGLMLKTAVEVSPDLGVKMFLKREHSRVYLVHILQKILGIGWPLQLFNL